MSQDEQAWVEQTARGFDAVVFWTVVDMVPSHCCCRVGFGRHDARSGRASNAAPERAAPTGAPIQRDVRTEQGSTTTISRSANTVAVSGDFGACDGV